jgi:hypothetical protein
MKKLIIIAQLLLCTKLLAFDTDCTFIPDHTNPLFLFCDTPNELVFKVENDWHIYAKKDFFSEIILSANRYLKKNGVAIPKNPNIKIYGFVPELMPSKSLLKISYQIGDVQILFDRVFENGIEANKMDQISVLDEQDYPLNYGHLAKSVLLSPAQNIDLAAFTNALKQAGVRNIKMDPSSPQLWEVETPLLQERRIYNVLQESRFESIFNSVQLNNINESLAFKKWLYTYSAK